VDLSPHEVDVRISEIAREVDFYSLLTPLNHAEERERFFACLRDGQEYNPVFRYRERDTREARKELEAMRAGFRSGEEPGPMRGGFRTGEELGAIRAELSTEEKLQAIFARKLDFMRGQLDLLDQGDAGFGEVSVRLYGAPDDACLRTATEILKKSRDERYAFPDETVTPAEMATALTEELDGQGLGWKCVLSGKIVPKITVSGRDRTIYINAGINYTAAEIERLKVHEIKVHVYRGANGDLQPYRIFREGLAGYDETEEGLAIISEETAGCFEEDTRQMKLYAGRALCTDLCLRGGFYGAFAALAEYFPEDIAYRLAERGKRGLRDTSLAGGLTKGSHYISGWRKLRGYIEAGGDMSILYTGKVGLDDIEAVRELLEEGILKAPKHLPGL